MSVLLLVVLESLLVVLLELGVLVEFGVSGVIAGLVVVVVPGDGLVVVLCCVPIEGCWSLGVVVCAMLRPAAATRAATAARLNAFFIKRLLPMGFKGETKRPGA